MDVAARWITRKSFYRQATRLWMSLPLKVFGSKTSIFGQGLTTSDWAGYSCLIVGVSGASNPPAASCIGPTRRLHLAAPATCFGEIDLCMLHRTPTGELWQITSRRGNGGDVELFYTFSGRMRRLLREVNNEKIYRLSCNLSDSKRRTWLSAK